MDKKNQQQYKRDLYKAILTLKNDDEVAAFLEDVCTIKEVNDMSQRLAVAKMLSDGCVFSEIGRITGTSSATISRVNKCLEYGSGGYKVVIDRLYGNK